MQAQKFDLALEVIADVLRAMIVAKLEAGGDLLVDGPEAAAYGLTDRLERFPAHRTPGGMDAEDLGSVMIDGEQHARRALARGLGAGQIRPPAHIRRRRNEGAFVQARSSWDAATRRSPQVMLAHQAKHAAAAGADPTGTKLRPHLAVPLPEKHRGSEHPADVLDKLTVGMPPLGPLGAPGGMDPPFERSTRSSGPSPEEHRRGSAGQSGSGKSTGPISLVRLPGG